MRFPHPVAVTCLHCGQPTVLAETSLGPVRVHCGTWRWQCDTPAVGTRRSRPHATTPAGVTVLGAASDQQLAA